MEFGMIVILHCIRFRDKVRAVISNSFLTFCTYNCEGLCVLNVTLELILILHSTSRVVYQKVWSPSLITWEILGAALLLYKTSFSPCWFLFQNPDHLVMSFRATGSTHVLVVCVVYHSLRTLLIHYVCQLPLSNSTTSFVFLSKLLDHLRGKYWVQCKRLLPSCSLTRTAY